MTNGTTDKKKQKKTEKKQKKNKKNKKTLKRNPEAKGMVCTLLKNKTTLFSPTFKVEAKIVVSYFSIFN